MVSSTHSPLVASRLTARDVSAGYGKKSIIKEVNIAIYDNEFSVIIGPNGCGKSTLLKPLAVLCNRSVVKFDWMVRMFSTLNLNGLPGSSHY